MTGGCWALTGDWCSSSHPHANDEAVDSWDVELGSIEQLWSHTCNIVAVVYYHLAT